MPVSFLKVIEVHVPRSRIKSLNISLIVMVKKKVQVGNDQEMAQSEGNSHSINRGWEKTKMTLNRYLYQENISYTE